MRKLFILLMIALLAACGGEEDASLSSGGGSQATPTEAPTAMAGGDGALASLPAPEPGALTLPDVPDTDGALIFTRGRQIYHGQFGGAAAETIIEDVAAASVEVSPDKRYAYHTSPGIRRIRLLGTELASGEQIELVRLSGGSIRQLSGQVHGFSPDGTWMLVYDLFDVQMYLVPTAGDAEATPLARDVWPVWLADNTILQLQTVQEIRRAIFENQVLEFAGFTRLDPATGEATPLDIAADEVLHLNDYANLVAATTDAGLELADPFELTGYSATLNDSYIFIVQPEENIIFQPAPCNTWAIEQMDAEGLRQVIYTVEDALWLTELTPLSDESFLFLEWRVSDCDLLSGTMTATLKRWHPDGTTTTVTDEVSPIEENRGNLNVLVYSQGHRFAVSPDGRYVVWPGGSLATGSSSLNITDLESGTTGVLLLSEVVTNPESYLDEQMFRSVFWLP